MQDSDNFDCAITYPKNRWTQKRQATIGWYSVFLKKTSSRTNILGTVLVKRMYCKITFRTDWVIKVQLSNARLWNHIWLTRWRKGLVVQMISFKYVWSLMLDELQRCTTSPLRLCHPNVPFANSSALSWKQVKELKFCFNVFYFCFSEKKTIVEPETSL